MSNTNLNQREEDFIVQNCKANPETLERYIKISELVKGDDIGNNLLEMLVIRACEYMQTICRSDVLMRTQAARLDGDDFRDFAGDLDRKRRLAHNALISSLEGLNRYCLKTFDECPIGGIYSLAPDTIHNRIAVGDWAGQLVYELFITRQK